MATIEKPKDQRKPKTKRKEVPAVRDEAASRNRISVASTSTILSNIPTQECLIASQREQSPEEKDPVSKIDTVVQTVDKQLLHEVESVQIDDVKSPEQAVIAPTAPVVDAAPIISATPQMMVQYPDISQLSISENLATPEVTPAKSFPLNLKPFTEVELKSLYDNVDSQAAEQFETTFLNVECNTNTTHPLFALLSQYTYHINYHKALLYDINALQASCEIPAKNFWVMHMKNGIVRGRCQDDKTVSNKISFEYAALNDAILAQYSKNIADLNEKLLLSYVPEFFAQRKLETQIDIYIFERIWLSMEAKPRSSDELRVCLSILFHFLRSPKSTQVFLENIKRWLEYLVAEQLRQSPSWENHLFLLHHVLRCPPGVGNWTASFIQVPVPSHEVSDKKKFSSTELNHSLNVLSKILNPIKMRSTFLQEWENSLKDIINSESDCWTLIDSDGDDNFDGDNALDFKEKDLVALFKQIPLESIFRSLMLIDKETGKIAETLVSGYHVLQTIAFSIRLVDILGNGLQSYDNEKYRHFLKRLSLVVAHNVKLLSSLVHIFKSKMTTHDDQILARVQIEYDLFLFKASRAIFKSKSMGTWQYLVRFPYSDCTELAVWNLYFAMHTAFRAELENNHQIEFPSILEDKQFYMEFYESLNDMPAENLYYLLQVFSNIAMSRQSNEIHLINIITLDLLEIGYLNEATKDVCYKITKDLLAMIVGKYPDLISKIIFHLHSKIVNLDEMGIYLFKNLPLNVWQPDLCHFEILASWLLNTDICHLNSSLTRIILAKLNWNINDNGQLFIAHDIHVRMACLIIEAHEKHVTSLGEGESHGIIDKLTPSSKSNSARLNFSQWCWDMSTVLRLHAIDQSKQAVSQFINFPSDILRTMVPELDSLYMIKNGVSKGNSLAMYIAILATTVGHSVPQICQTGFPLMQAMLRQGKVLNVLRCLEFCLPIFIECTGSLVKCEVFQTLLKDILSYDRTHKLLNNQSITDIFGKLVQSQIINYYRFGFLTPKYLIDLWLSCFLSIDGWQNDHNILHIVDLILQISYQFTDTRFCVREYLKKHCVQNFDTRSSSFFGLLKSPSKHSPIPISSSSPWLAMNVLQLEHDIFERETNLWPEILHELHIHGEKLTIDNCIKHCASIVGVSPFPASHLNVYKWANLIISMPIEHVLLPIFCQEFFKLYLEVVPLTEDEAKFEEKIGVSDRIYDGNISLMKKLKKHLIEIEKYNSMKQVEKTDGPLTEIYLNCSQLYKTFVLWLEENQLNHAGFIAAQLHPKFDRARLDMIHNKSDHWTELLPLPLIREKQKTDNRLWLQLCLRDSVSDKSGIASLPEDEQSIDRFIDQINFYEKCIGPPSVGSHTKQISELKQWHSSFHSRMYNMRQEFLTIKDYAKKHQIKAQEMYALDDNFKEWIGDAFTNQTNILAVQMSCGVTCTGSAQGSHHVTKVIENSKVIQRIENNRYRRDTIIKTHLTEIPLNIVNGICHLEHTIDSLILNYSNNSDQIERAKLYNAGKELFYTVIEECQSNISNQHNQYKPFSIIKETILSKLSFLILQNQNVEGPNLLKIVEKNKLDPKIIRRIYQPMLTEPKIYISMYHYVLANFNKPVVDEEKWHTVLNQFFFQKWMLEVKLNQEALLQLSSIIINGLNCNGHNNSSGQLLQSILRQHLVAIFENEFPKNCADIIKLIFTECSAQTIHRSVLLDVLNSLYKRNGCTMLNTGMPLNRFNEELRNFSSRNHIIKDIAISDTVIFLSKHFYAERFERTMKNLYDQHGDHCEVLAMWIGSFGCLLIVSMVHKYPGILAEELIQIIWPFIDGLFSPWLAAYNAQVPKNDNAAVAVWIKNTFDKKQQNLIPWKDKEYSLAQKMIEAFTSCIQFLMETFPTCNLIYERLFNWYETHFAFPSVPSYIHGPIHQSLLLLPWKQYQPSLMFVECLNRILELYVPDCHAFIGEIFIQIDWKSWVLTNIHSWDIETRSRTLAYLFSFHVKLTFEPNMANSTQMTACLSQAAHYPWYFVDFEYFQSTMNWFVTSTEPFIVLKLPSELDDLHNSVLNLIEVASAMHSVPDEYLLSSQPQAKRIIYVRTIVRLLRACGTKHPELISNDFGKRAFYSSVDHLLTITNHIALKYNQSEYRQREVVNLLMEMVGSMQLQGETVSRLFSESFLKWQSKSDIGNDVLCFTLNAIGMCKQFGFNLRMLLEATLFNYFRNTEQTLHIHNPCWSNVTERIGSNILNVSPQQFVKNDQLLALHAYMLVKLKNTDNAGDSITFLQDVQKLIVDYKSNEMTEPKLVLIWGLLICSGCSLSIGDTSKSQLLSLARHFQVLSTQSEGWSEGFLAVIGFKKDGVSIHRRILTRCLAGLLFSLFPETQASTSSSEIHCREYEMTIAELKNAMQAKKFNEIRDQTCAAIQLLENRSSSRGNIFDDLSKLISLFYRDSIFNSLKFGWQLGK